MFGLFDDFPDAVVVSDRLGRVAYANRALERLLGWPVAELAGRTLTMLMPERLRAAHRAGFDRFMTTGVSHIIGRPTRVAALHEDGTELDIELTLSAFDRGGEPWIVASLRDLRERNEIERERDVHRRVMAHYEVVRTLMSTGDGDDVMPAILAALGTTLGWSVGIAWQRASDDAPLHATATWAADAGAVAPFLEVTRQTTFTGREGLPGLAWTTRSASWTADAAADDWYLRRDAARASGLHAAVLFPVVAGARVHAVLEFVSSRGGAPDEELVQTMTAIGYQIAQFLEGREAHARAVQVRDDFLAIAAHELRTPLTPLRLQVESLALRVTAATPPPPAELAARLGKMVKQIDRMHALVEELLDLSRITQGRLALHREPVDLVALVREVTDRYQVPATPLLVTTDAVVTGSWDPLRVEQVLVNLLDNAMKFGAGREVEVAVRGAGPRAILEVRDHGPGISAEDQARIFDRFERAVSTRHFGGFGLGLWIVGQIVAAMDGTITVDSQPDAGACFRVELPRAG